MTITNNDEECKGKCPYCDSLNVELLEIIVLSATVIIPKSEREVLDES